MNYLNELDIKELLAHALKEDIGVKDITTESFIPAGIQIDAVIVAKEKCVLCGVAVAAQILRLHDRSVVFRPLRKDGARLKKGEIIAKIKGNAKSILTAERVMLNFLSFLSGIATQTSRFVEAVKPYNVKVLDTRKTIPCLRLLEKYAVRIGGGYNHRLRLDEMIMIKDNHLKVAGFRNIIARAHDEKIRARKIEIEVSSLEEFKLALTAGADVIMLDNMPASDIKKAVALRNRLTAARKPTIEASGGITLKTIRRIASCGVEMISVGALTHSVDSVDLSLDIVD